MYSRVSFKGIIGFCNRVPFKGTIGFYNGVPFKGNHKGSLERKPLGLRGELYRVPGAKSLVGKCFGYCRKYKEQKPYHICVCIHKNLINISLYIYIYVYTYISACMCVCAYKDESERLSDTCSMPSLDLGFGTHGIGGLDV